jgi:hypothetical protein
VCSLSCVTKSSRKLHACAQLLELKLLTIGRILSTRWVAYSFRSVSGVWEDYEGLVLHFVEAKNDYRRDKDLHVWGFTQEDYLSWISTGFRIDVRCTPRTAQTKPRSRECDMDLHRASKKEKILLKYSKKERNVTDHIMKMPSLLQNVSPSKELPSTERM